MRWTLTAGAFDQDDEMLTTTMNTNMNMFFTMAMSTITMMNTSKERFHFVISGQFCDVISSFYFISR